MWFRFSGCILHLSCFDSLSFSRAIATPRRYDLLEPDNANLSIREDTKKGVYCENLHEMPVASAADALKLAVIGAQNRRVAATAMNRESSRSHALFCLTITSKEVCVLIGMICVRQCRGIVPMNICPFSL
jgi:hypothetical protein